MKVQINLATRPFVELRPYMLRLRWIMGGIACISVALLIAAHLLQERLDVALIKMHAIEARVNAATSEKQANERQMRQPANAAVLDRAHFLNALFLRKSFSWTAVMMDLETVLPSGVQVTSIEPGVSADGEVIIRMRVAGDRDRAVQLVRNLEHSKRFLHPRLSSEAVQAKNLPQVNAAAANGTVGNVEFEILANYNPLPEDESYSKGRVAADVDAAPSNTAAHLVAGRTTKGSVAPAKPSGLVLKPMVPMQPKQQQPTPAQPSPAQAPPAVQPAQSGAPA